MGVLLWATGFFNSEELRWLNRLMRARTSDMVVLSADTTEMAGEIVSVDVPDELIPTKRPLQ
jgi:hypothetical protein